MFLEKAWGNAFQKKAGGYVLLKTACGHVFPEKAWGNVFQKKAGGYVFMGKKSYAFLKRGWDYVLLERAFGQELCVPEDSLRFCVSEKWNLHIM